MDIELTSETLGLLQPTTNEDGLKLPGLRKKRVYVPRVNSGGNYCGHNPDKPQFIPATPINEGKGGRPPILVKLAERLLAYYKRPEKILPSLNNANSSTRQQRSERREACILVLITIVNYLELSSLRVGVPNKDGFRSLKIKTIAHKAGLSLSRTERAISDLIKAKLLYSHRRCKKDENGNYKGLASVKLVSKLLFQVFGLNLSLDRERSRAYQRLQQKYPKTDHKVSSPTKAKQRLLLQQHLSGSSNSKQSIVLPDEKQVPAEDQTFVSKEENKRRMQITLDIAEEHPDWGVKEIKKELNRRLS